MKIDIEFQDAVKNDNRDLVRIMLKDSIMIDPTLDMYKVLSSYAKANLSMPLYEKYDGIAFADEVDWNEDYFNQEMIKLLDNFSKERIIHLEKVCKKIYSGYITLIGEGNKYSIKKLSLGEYNNISNEDIDIICTFLGNLVTRIIQVLEFVVIYFYFLSIDIYIFLITIIVSIVLVAIFLMTGSGVQKLNQERKDSLDKKIIVVNDMYNTIKENKSNYDVLKKRFYARSNEYLRNNSNFNVIAQLIIYVVLSIIEISRYFLILYAIYLVYIGKMEIGTILLIYTYYSQILSNFEVMGTINVNYRSFLVSVSRLNRININEIKE